MKWTPLILRKPALRCAPRPGSRAGCRVVRLAVPFVLAVVPAAWATDAIEPIGVSMQSRMRGGADVAVGDSALSQIDNPATLSLQPRGLYTLDEASKLAIIDLPWRGPLGTYESSYRLVHLHNLGLATPIDERLTFGLAVHSKAGLGTRFNARHLMIPWMKRRVGADTKNLAVHFTGAYKVTEKLSIGLGARAEVATSEFSKVLGPADVEFGRGYAYGGGFQLGLHYQARDDLAFGLGYRSPSWFGDLAGGSAQASLLGLLPVPLGEAAISDLQLPQKVTGGVAWDATDWLKLVGEVRWFNFENSSFHNLTIATDGIVDLRYPVPLGYRDLWAFIIGAEFKLDEHWVFGTGYHYTTTPVERANLSPECTIPVQHHATFGLRYETEKWWVGGGYVIGFRGSLAGPGYSRIPLGIDYGFSEVAQTQHMISIGFGFRW